MNRVAVVNMYGVVPGESGYSRSHYISKFLSEGGFDVDFIVGSFNHFSKSFKDRNFSKNQLPYNTVILDNPSYRKNVSYERIRSFKVFKKNLRDYLNGRNGEYKAIVNIIPPAEVGIECIRYCRRNGIPYIIDLNDLWPEAMSMAIKNKFLWYILTTPFRRAANKVYSEANGIIGTSNTYTNRPLTVNKKNPHTLTVYVGTDIDEFDRGVIKNTKDIEKGASEFWVTYAGTLGTSYDIHTMMKAGGILKQRGYKDIKFVILGDGPLRSAFEQTGRDCGCNALFLGYTKYDVMAAYLNKSDILVNSFIKSAPQSIVNKVGDYLSAGKPMINTCSDLEMRQLVDDSKIGENVVAEDEIALSDLIEKMYKDKELRDMYSLNARRMAEREFDRKTSYQKIVQLVKQLIENT